MHHHYQAIWHTDRLVPKCDFPNPARCGQAPRVLVAVCGLADTLFDSVFHLQEEGSDTPKSPLGDVGASPLALQPGDFPGFVETGFSTPESRYFYKTSRLECQLESGAHANVEEYAAPTHTRIFMCNWDVDLKCFGEGLVFLMWPSLLRCQGICNVHFANFPGL
jgi:hypothetical protein